MKPSRRLIAMLLVVAGLAVGVAKLSVGGSVTVRPVVLTVLEAGTRRPLPGVPIRYAVEAAVLRGRVLGALPAPESVLGWKIIAKEVGVTDERGQWRTVSKNLRLSRGEVLDRELFFVNLAPDPAHPAIQDVLDGVEWQCSEDKRLCGLAPDTTDVLREVIAGSPQERLEVLRNPNQTHLGAVVLGVRHAATSDAKDWARQGDCFHVQWLFKSLGEAAEDVTVELKVPRSLSGAK